MTYSETFISKNLWVAVALSVLFLVAFLLIRMKSAYATHGTKNIALDYKRNEHQYWSSLLVCGGIFSVVNLIKAIMDYIECK